MNLKRLLSFGALTMFSASIATGQGTAPTIVQGDYISNVFGNSNFVKNPNAKLNTKDVTFTGSQVSRSATNPLVATSEFNLSLASGANATWTLRAFDQGMKGQNCEARFTYRGFATATTKAELVQNSLVVASLTLTPTTDPRIASINFPCGDLTYATTFRIAQTTAAMTGTNELGGLYVGLATNMANVAQAEEVGSYYMEGIANCVWTTSSTSWANYAADADCNTGTVTGAADTTAGKIPGVKFNNLKPGKYQFIASFSGAKTGAVAETVYFRVGDGTTYSPAAFHYINSTSETYIPRTIIYTTEYTTITSPTIQASAYSISASNSATIFNSSSNINFKITAYRFPSSSELVVKPETQNVWGEISGTGVDSLTTSTSYVTPSGFSALYTLGKCLADGTNMACKISTLPPGAYQVSVSTPYFAEAGSALQGCYIQIIDNKGAVDAPSGQGAAKAGGLDGITSISRVFNYTSVQTDVIFSFKHRQTTGTGGSCGVFTSSGRYFSLLVRPLDQPSNSALYVQGPILGAQTGAAIASGYVGEDKRSIITTLTNAAATTVVKELTNIELTPGVWLISASATLYANSATLTDDASICITTTSASCAGASFAFNYVTAGRPINSSAGNSSATTPAYTVTVTATQRYYLNIVSYYSAGTPQWRGGIVATRLN